jgi:hypothetical protein
MSCRKSSLYLAYNTKTKLICQNMITTLCSRHLASSCAMIFILKMHFLVKTGWLFCYDSSHLWLLSMPALHSCKEASKLTVQLHLFQTIVRLHLMTVSSPVPVLAVLSPSLLQVPDIATSRVGRWRAPGTKYLKWLLQFDLPFGVAHSFKFVFCKKPNQIECTMAV